MEFEVLGEYNGVVGEDQMTIDITRDLIADPTLLI